MTSDSAASRTTSTPEPPIPDSKDWTWVLDEQCDFCGFDGRHFAAVDVAVTVTQLVPRWIRVLDRDDVAVRPAPAVWSALEYGCHVRDVFGVFAERAELILTDDDARFADWDQDATALAGRYWQQAPEVVAEQLAARARHTSAVFAAVPEYAWNRPGRRSNGSAFTLGSLGRYMVHDVVHHLADVAG
ncbi:DinB family protein [Actinoplanes sp. NPDC023801]|uniref:DinB family protein n=1 Tax=Actinoplanes sp. NPDC023801 TaxID=3154595 RepID=UPI0033C9D34E